MSILHKLGEIEITDNFDYLRIALNYTGSFVLNNQFLKGKALRAICVLYNNIKLHQVLPDTSLQLFDSFVVSILNYASPIWGFYKAKNLEQVHLKFCKWILGVKSNACIAAVYGELWRYPL